MSFFDILENADYDPDERAQVFLWLIYVHLETDLTNEAIEESLTLFEVKGKFELSQATEDIDTDPPEEVEFGETQKAKRKEFLLKNNRLAHDGNRKSDANRPLMEQTKLESSSAEDPEYFDDERAAVETPPPKAVHRTSPRVTKKTIQKTNLIPLAKASAKGTPLKRQSRKQAKPVTEELVIEQQDPKVTPKPEEVAVAVAAAAEEEAKAKQESQSKSDTEPITLPMKKKARKKSASGTPASQAVRNEVLDEKKKDEMEALIKFDKSEEVAEHRTQDALMQELEQAQALTRLKREELGLVKMFHEFEDVTMATVIGVRGKKRKKFKDGLLGFETDFIRTMSGAKRAMLANRQHAEENIYEFK